MNKKTELASKDLNLDDFPHPLFHRHKSSTLSIPFTNAQQPIYTLLTTSPSFSQKSNRFLCPGPRVSRAAHFFNPLSRPLYNYQLQLLILYSPLYFYSPLYLLYYSLCLFSPLFAHFTAFLNAPFSVLLSAQVSSRFLNGHFHTMLLAACHQRICAVILCTARFEFYSFCSPF